MSKVAAIQMCSSLDVQENLITAEKLIRQAVSMGAQLVVLPEMFATFGINESSNVIFKEQFGQGNIQDFLAKIASQCQIWIVEGTIPLACSDSNKYRAACLVYNDKGACVGRYDKLHLFNATISPAEVYRESEFTEAGIETTVIHTPFGKLGLAVCFDIRFPDIFTNLYQQGAEMIAMPAAFTVKTGQAHWKLLARARAVEHFFYFIGAAQGGHHPQGRKTYGHSLLVNPWGAVMASLEHDLEGVICHEMDLSDVDNCRKAIPLNYL